MTINGRTAAHVAALRSTLEYVLAHPDEHDQEVWGTAYDLSDPGERDVAPACGTSYCFAGHAVVTIARAHPIWDDSYVDEAGRTRPCGDLVEVVPAGHDPADEDARVHVVDHASDVLGLNPAERLLLFAAHNTLTDLAELIWTFTAGEVDRRAEAAEVDRFRRVAP